MDIFEILRKNKKLIEKDYSVKKIGIFGSFVRGEENAYSDVDILVEFSNPTYDNFFELSTFLEDLFNKKVDLITVKGLNPYIIPYVEEEGVWC